MGVYDQARELAAAIKQETVYSEYEQIKSQVFADPKLKQMLLDLRRQELELQKQQLMGKEVTQEQKDKARQLHEIVRLNSTLARFFEVECRFGRMMMDIQKIINDVVPVEKPE
jgi:cell fate (sporulation/competence/biofilm development) regulator YlbF (YheA/YmcA/DUF963 family)